MSAEKAPITGRWQSRGTLQARRIEIRPAEWNGRTINPQELVALETRKK